METATSQTQRQRISYKVITFAVYFVGWIAMMALFDRLWPPAEPFLHTVKHGVVWALLMAIFGPSINRGFWRRKPDSTPPRIV